VNLTTAICPHCPGKVCGIAHLEGTHSIIVPDVSILLEEVQKRQVVRMKPVFLNGNVSYIRKILRKKTLQKVGDYLRQYIERIKAHLSG